MHACSRSSLSTSYSLSNAVIHPVKQGNVTQVQAVLEQLRAAIQPHLSPQARGEPNPWRRDRTFSGPIPAGAGEPNPWRRDRTFSGPIPAGAGKLPRQPPPSALPGPIPAGAGETFYAQCVSRPVGAYPRRRGGNQFGVRCGRFVKGLSPQARGKPTANSIRAKRSGPIPAGAGETARRLSAPRMRRAYPRRRGGNHALSCVTSLN